MTDARRCFRRARACAFAAFYGLTTLTVASAARAQTPSEVVTARRWFADGLASEEKGDFPAALDLFRRAQQVKRTPQIAYHVGLCESRTGALVVALVDLDGAAAMARAAGADKVVVAAEAELAEVRRRVPTLELHVAATEKADTLSVDGHALSLSMLGTPMPLDPGSHSVMVGFASGRSATQTMVLAERDVKTVELSPPAPVPIVAPTPEVPPVAVASPVVVPPPPLPPPPAPPGAAHHRSVLPWVVTGAGGAVAVAGVALFVAAHLDVGTLDSECPNRTCPASATSASGTYSTAKTLDGLGIGLGVAGLAAAGVGVAMVLWRPSTESSSTLGVGPTGLTLRGSF